MITRRRQRSSIGLNLTSMIDVVFLLLIYFMVATEFKTTEESFPMDLPVRSHEQRVQLDDEPLVIHVESAGANPRDIRLRLDGPWDPIDSLDALKHFLVTNLADGFGNHGLFTMTHPILIVPTKNTRWDHTIAAYNAVAQAKYTNITLDEPS